MSELEAQICRILRKHFRCCCGLKPPYCTCVADLFDFVLEKIEEELEKRDEET